MGYYDQPNGADGLAAASWFCLGLVFIAAVAAAMGLLGLG
jgi:hypothetical protein